jgi:methionyl-tRNA formyltransferase
MEQPKILILCGGKFAFPTIQILALEKYLCGVGIGKADKEVAGFLEGEADKAALPFRSFPDRASIESLADWIREINPDYIFSICFPFLVPEEALAFGEDRFFNFHTGPLPEYRGPMPIFEVLRYGETETAICVHRMTSDFDDGAIVLSEYIDIAGDDTFGSLAVKLSEHTSLAAHNMAQMLEFGTFVPQQEQDESNARYFEFPESEDTTIQWGRMNAGEISDLIRACNSWNNGADAVLNGKPVKVLQAETIDEPHKGFPGNILGPDDQGRMRIACLNEQQLAVEVVNCDLGIITAARYMKSIPLNKLIVN